MKRHLLTFAVAALAGLLLSAGSAQACHKRKCRSSCEPAPCAQPAPCAKPVCQPCPPPPCPPEPCAKPCRPKLKLNLGGLCGKKRGCEPACAPAPAPCGQVVTVAYTSYAAPQWQHVAPSGQAAHAAPQAVPAKQMPPVPGK